MNWPAKLISQFDEAIDVTGGLDKRSAIVLLLDQAAWMAVRRCKAEPRDLVDAYFTPYTPIGELTASCLGGAVSSFGIHGHVWGQALDQLRAFVGANAQAIIDDYKDGPFPRHDQGG